MRHTLLAAAVLAVAAFAVPASAAEINGVWKTEKGASAQVYDCGKAVCIKLIDGKFKGRVISDDLVDDGSGTYSGSITNPEDDRTYSGYATVSGSTLKLKGCALKIFCKSQSWSRLK